MRVRLGDVRAQRIGERRRRSAAARASIHSAATPFGPEISRSKSNSMAARVHDRVQSTIRSERPLLTIAHDRSPARPMRKASRQTDAGGRGPRHDEQHARSPRQMRATKPASIGAAAGRSWSSSCSSGMTATSRMARVLDAGPSERDTLRHQRTRRRSKAASRRDRSPAASALRR